VKKPERKLKYLEPSAAVLRADQTDFFPLLAIISEGIEKIEVSRH